MTCTLCNKPIDELENRIVLVGHGTCHLCCWLKGVAEEMRNNATAFALAGKTYRAAEVFQLTVPIACNHEKA